MILASTPLLIAGISVLGIVFFHDDLAQLVATKGKGAKFEDILPQVLSRGFVPVGFKGILIAALLASFMSTFVSTVNSGAAYVVNDIYKRYFNPNAPPRRYVVCAWITSSTVILLGIAFGFGIPMAFAAILDSVPPVVERALKGAGWSTPSAPSGRKVG